MRPRRLFRKVLKELGAEVPVILVSESGASVYSASDVAREDSRFGSDSSRCDLIARRLQDPLAELVKVDPKSIGVGQYQHHVSQTALKKSLEEVVESCVNGVGVDLNTASAPLLAYVAGIRLTVAKGIVEFRKTNGLFSERDQLLKVGRFSPKVFEQSAGFLRIPVASILWTQQEFTLNAMPQFAIWPPSGVPVTGLLGDGAKEALGASNEVGADHR